MLFQLAMFFIRVLYMYIAVVTKIISSYSGHELGSNSSNLRDNCQPLEELIATIVLVIISYILQGNYMLFNSRL